MVAVPLSAHEADVLFCLYANRDRPVLMEALFEMLWGADPSGGPLHYKSIISKLMICLERKLPGHAIKRRSGNLGYLLIRSKRNNATRRVRHQGRDRPAVYV